MNENVTLGSIAIPDPENPHNYMFDTTAFNRLADNFGDMDVLVKSKAAGFMYYKTANQDYELNGRGANVYDKNGLPSFYKKSEKLEQKQPFFDEINEKLSVQRVSSVASLMRNHWILDGTYRLWDDKSPGGQVMKEILEFNENKRKKRPFSQHYDAMIAEAALYNNCILVTNDSDLKNIVNNSYPCRAICYEELVRRANNSLST